MNKLKTLQQYGQSVWLDYIRRSLITSGELQRMIKEDGLMGVTSNPAIFEKAITGSTDYVDAFKAIDWRPGQNVTPVYERVAIRDIQDAADALKKVYQKSKRRDGYVSFEVSPYLAHDTQGTIREARRLWEEVGRENLMIKVPATDEGIPAIEQLISEGINVNCTLLFSREFYERVAEAYIAGLEKFADGGGDLSKMASVASFFISRIDQAVDSAAESKIKVAQTAPERALLRSIMGKVAIANAKLTYQKYKEIFGSPRWRALANGGAQTQRLLWASTGTKNPSYSDVLYCDELIGPDTVNTMPPATLDAFRQHGQPRPSLEDDVESAHDTMETLEELGISMAAVTSKLLDQGVELFSEAFDRLLHAVEEHFKTAHEERPNWQTYTLPKKLSSKVKSTLEDWQDDDKVHRLWACDASLWTRSDEANWLGWLGITDDQRAHIQPLRQLADEARSGGFTHALLLGMGGSSLGPEVLVRTFGHMEGHPQLHVLDSTDPTQVWVAEGNVDLAKALFIVSSKSGTTLEPNIFEKYFYDRVRQVVGEENVGEHFIAITDPGSKLEQLAESKGFRHVFHGLPSIGGRYSVLSNFGIVPAAVMGIDVSQLLDRADQMRVACGQGVAAQDNPGVVLGAILGVLANDGRDKVTLITSPGLSAFGAWLEQLLAESTGKDGRGLIPVDREPLGPPEDYGDDRQFYYVRLESAPDAAQDEAVEALARSGRPVVRIPVPDIYCLGGEFFRWEIATAVAGSIIGINPFNQPDVEAAKIATRKLTAEYQETGVLPSDQPILEENGVKLFADIRNAAALTDDAGADRTVVGYLRAHLNRLTAGDYFSLQAYIEMNSEHEGQLEALRRVIRDSKHVATCLGFGPRFLHSTGQAYKGGPNSGVFLQITCDDATDVPIPGQKYTFGVVKAAQALGDFQVLADRERRLLRIHLGKDVPSGLASLQAAVEQALEPARQPVAQPV